MRILGTSGGAWVFNMRSTLHDESVVRSPEVGFAIAVPVSTKAGIINYHLVRRCHPPAIPFALIASSPHSGFHSPSLHRFSSSP
jgi:hypothetical protein